VNKLYLRLYLALLASLLVFALATGFLWRQFGDMGAQFETAAVLVQNALPPNDASAAEHQAVLDRLLANLRVDVSLFAADGSPLASVGQPFAAPEEPGRVRGGGWATRLPDGRWAVARAPEGRRGPGFGFTLFIVALLAIGVGAYPVVRRLTRRLEQLQGAVEALGAGNLGARVEVKGKDEVARLAQAFNRSASQVEALVRAHKSLLANASHELRTPLARIRMGVELVKQGSDPRREEELRRDIAELDAMIEEILLASRLDAAGDLEPAEEVDLLGLAAEECSRYDGVELDGEPVMVRGASRLLRRAIRNLLENARRHGAPPVRVRVGRAGALAEIVVADGGKGIAQAERERIFEPFHRVPGTTPGTGAGLGLALVRQIARRHGGEASYRDGFCVTFRLA